MASNNLPEYGDGQIKTLTGIQHYRFRASMYGFQMNSINGVLLGIKEIIDNSADEALDRNRVYPIDVTFFVSKDKKTFQCLVQDRGRGIPVGKLVDCLATANTSGKYEGSAYQASTGTNGCGSKVVAALSKQFVAFTKRMDGFGYLRIEKGDVKDQYTTRKPLDKNQDTVGTTVIYQPDDELLLCTGEMFGQPAANEVDNGLAKLLQRVEYYSLFRPNIQLTIRVVDGLLPKSDFNKDHAELWRYLTDLTNFSTKTVYQSIAGRTPREYVTEKYNLKQPIWELGKLEKPQSENPSDDPLSYEIDVFLDEKSLNGDNGFVAGVNSTPIVHPESTHISMFQDVVKSFLLDSFTNDEEKAFFEARYRIPFSGCISVGWQGAEFVGQDKTRFEDRRFGDCYRSSLRKALKKITETKGEGFWDSLYGIIRNHFDSEYARFTRRSFRSSASVKNLRYELLRAGSFSNCTSTNNQITEIFITEGDSAAGRVNTERDEVTQAVFKLSGKPINAIRASADALRKNAVFQDLITVLGVSPADKNLDNMRFQRILIMTDADADGYHIVALLIGILYTINPLILTEGRVHVTNPPLYAYTYKDEETVYIRDENALTDVRMNAFRTLIDVDISFDGKTRFNINKNRDQFRSMCSVMLDLGYKVSHEADLLNIDPYVLEQLMHCAKYLAEDNVNTKKIIEILDLEDAFWDKENNVLIIVDKGSLERRIPLSNLQKRIQTYLLPEYQRFHWDKYTLFITTKFSDTYVGNPCSFMMLYSIYQTLFLKEKCLMSVSRFKGLGEMTKESITKTCIDPATRCFTVVRGLGDVDAMFKMLDVDTDARKKLIKAGFIEE